MDLQQSAIMANKFQAVLDADVLNERGKQRGFAKRERLITPFRLGLSVVASMATQQEAQAKRRDETFALGKSALFAAFIEDIGIENSLELVGHDGRLLEIHPTFLS